MVVYVAGPFRGKTAWDVERNIREAEELGFRVAQVGAMPLIPHANTRFFNGTLTDEFWLAGTLELLRRCDALVKTHRWEVSSGARAEVKEARALGIPVFSHLDLVRLKDWIEERKEVSHV